MLVDSHCHLDQLDLTIHNGDLKYALGEAKKKWSGIFFMCLYHTQRIS